MIIAVDFDGTCVTHDYPRVGKQIGAAAVLRELDAAGHKLMLWTMRGNKPVDDRYTLKEAVDWFLQNDIPLWGINENPEQKESGWSNSNKQYAQLYIDDAALGAPLTRMYQGREIHHRPFIDWQQVLNTLVADGIITEEAWTRATDFNKLVPEQTPSYSV